MDGPMTIETEEGVTSIGIELARIVRVSPVEL
jgi:hypothetical protein